MLAVSSALAQTGREIAQKVKDRPDGDTRQSEMTMKLINKRGSVRERKLLSYSIDVGKGKKDRKTIMFFSLSGGCKRDGLPYLGLRRNGERRRQVALPPCHEENSAHQWLLS